MIRNYLNAAIRSLRQQAGYTLINVSGLAVGLACGIVILLYLQHQFSFDRHHQKADRIYRVVPTQRLEDGTLKYNYATYGPVGPAMAEVFPEIETATRFMYRSMHVNVQGEESLESTLLAADPECLNVFDFAMVGGNMKEELRKPFTAMVSQKLSRKLFGRGNPIGQVVYLDSKFFNREYTIVGILEEIPESSTYGLAPELITSWNSLESAWAVQEYWEEWFSYPMTHTYILLRPNASVSGLQEKMPQFVKTHWGEDSVDSRSYELMPLTQLHLNGKRRFGLYGSTGDINSCYTLALLGVVIVGVACINFVNLTLSRSPRRMREIGMRKVIGAQRSQIVLQFLCESVCLSSASLLAALGLAYLILPSFNTFMSVQLHLADLSLLLLFAGTVTIGILAGSYPALYLSAFRPVTVLKGMRNPKRGRQGVRKGLVVVQFGVSLMLIFGTIVVFAQTEHMRSVDVGFDDDVLLFANLWGQYAAADQLKPRLQQAPGVASVTISNSPPFANPGDLELVTSEVSGESRELGFNMTDSDYVDTYGLSLVSGRGFRAGDFRLPEAWGPPGPGPLTILLNETASRLLNIEPGDRIRFRGASHEVVGVIQDYHELSLHHSIRPLMLLCMRLNQAWVSVRIDTQRLPEAMAAVETILKEVLPNRAPDLVFFDDIQRRVYHSDLKLRELYTVSSVLSIAIACLGLLGLISHSVETRTKEIGIRKVLGSSEVGILTLVTRDLFYLVVVASLLAYPVAYFVMEEWLQNYAYRINLSFFYLVLSTAVATSFMFATVSYHAVKAARQDPISALRYE